MMFKLSTGQILDCVQFDEQHGYCACLHKMFQVNYLRGKYNRNYVALLMLSIVLCILT